MKKIALNLFIIAAVTMTCIACKSEKKNKAEAEIAEKVAEKTEGAHKFVVDTALSTIEWKGEKPTGEHIGSIAIKSGHFFFNENKLESGEIVIDMTSITVKDEGMPNDKKKMLKAHLEGTVEGKEGDFFNTPKYPTASFKVTDIKVEGENTLLEGNLTMKRQTHNVTFPVAVTWAADHSSVEIASEPFTIDRTKWGVNYGSKTIFDSLGNNWISDDIQLIISVKAAKK